MALKDTKVGEAHVDIVANLSGLKKDLASVKSQMKSIGGSAGGLAMQLTALFTGIGAAFAVFSAVFKVLQGIMRLLEKIVSFVIDVLKAAFNILKNVITGVFNAIIAGAKAAFRAMQRFGGFLYKSIRVASDFRHEMKLVGVILQANAADQKKLSEAALELGKKTEFMASQAAQAMQSMARAGLDVNTILKETGTVLDFATAMNIPELSTSAELLLGITRGMGIELKYLGGVADLMGMIVNSSMMDTTMLGEAFKNVAPVANALGQDIREVSAALGVLANNADTASLAGTHLRMTLIELASPKATAAFQKLGITLRGAGNQLKPLSEVIKEFNAAVPAAERADKAFEIFGKRSAVGFVLLMQAGHTAMDEMLKKMKGAQGYIQMAAAVMRATVERSFDILGSSWEAFQIAVGDIFGPVTLQFNTFLSDVINGLTHLVKEWTPWLQKQIKVVLEWIQTEVPKFLKALLGTIHFFWNDIAEGFTKVINFFGGKGGFFRQILGIDAIAEGAGSMQALFTIMLTLFDKLKFAFTDMITVMKHTLESWLQIAIHQVKKFAMEASGAHLEGGVQDLRPLRRVEASQDAFFNWMMKRESLNPKAMSDSFRVREIRLAIDDSMNMGGRRSTWRQTAETLGIDPSQVPEAARVTPKDIGKVEEIERARGFFGFPLSKLLAALSGIDEAFTDLLEQGERDMRDLKRKHKTEVLTADEKAEIQANAAKAREEMLKELFAEFGKGTESKKWADLMWDKIMGAIWPGLPVIAKPLPIPPPPKAPPAGGGGGPAAMPATQGTISTVFGAMKVAVNDEVRLLRQIVRWNKMIATNTRTQTLI